MELENLTSYPASSEGRRIYLAVPYSHEDPGIMHARYLRVTLFLRKLSDKGLMAFSPITYGHFLESQWQIRQSYEYWIDFGLAILEKWATDIFVLKLPGWEISSGVARELEAARSLGLGVAGIDPLKELRYEGLE